MPFATVLPAIGAAAVAWFVARYGQERRWRKTVRRLHDADAQLRALVDHSSSAIYLKDRNRRYLLANRRHLDLWPEMRDFRPGMTPFDFFPEHVARSFGESDDAVWESGLVHTFEEEIPHGVEMHTFVSSKFPVRDAQGTIIAVGGISTDVTDLKRAEANIARKEQKLRRLIDVQETEKQQLCHEFHDGLIQHVVGCKMMLDALDRHGLRPDDAATIDTVVGNLARGLEDGRRVIRGIRPAALDDLGLVAALEDLCDQSWPGCPAIAADIDPHVDEIAAGLQTTVYRIVQESLSNACRHSGASRASVVVQLVNNGVHVTISDSGRGFDPRSRGTTGFGLIGMEERIRLAGGDITIESAPGAGTRVAARLPLG